MVFSRIYMFYCSRIIRPLDHLMLVLLLSSSPAIQKHKNNVKNNPALIYSTLNPSTNS